VLRPAGVLVLSSPNRDVYPQGNPHHTHEFRPGELEDALARKFANVRLYRQSAWLAAAILGDDQSRAVGPEGQPIRVVKIAPVAPGDEEFTVALASDTALPDPEALIMMGKPFEARWWEEQVRNAVGERDQELEQRIRQQSEREVERRWHADALVSVEAELAQARNEIAQLQVTTSELRTWAQQRAKEWDERISQSEQSRGDFENRLRRAERTIDDITGSLSWRITAPLRAVMRLLRRVAD
jgi:hypothetical protein